MPNLGTSMVFTLPEDLGQDDEQALDAWTQATMDVDPRQCPRRTRLCGHASG